MDVLTLMNDKFTAIVLAGDRGPDDPVAKAAGVSCKALVPIYGRPMILRVIDALEGSSAVGSLVVCGSSPRLRGHSPELDGLIATGRICWAENQSSPSLSAQAALSVISDDRRVLITTADHALLTPGMVDYFCSQAQATGCDVVAGLARAEIVATAFPESRRTVTRLRDGGYCGCNLFAFLTPSARKAAKFWRRVEEQRKHPLKIAGVLGIVMLLRYLLGRLTLGEGLARMSELMGLQAGAVWMPDAEAAVDVDSLADLRLVERYLGGIVR
jgi:GTP:adenosylcobinamide-phosphate guanylyltransferase